MVALGAILGSTMMDGGKISALLNPSAAILIIGGTVGATMIAHSLGEVIAIPRLVVQAMRNKHYDELGIVKQLVAFAVKARREGLLSLEEEIGKLEEPFLVRGLQMVVDGTDPEMVRSIMETDINHTAWRHQRGAQVFETAGGYAPTMGIIGTVMGLIHVLSNLADSNKLGASIAVAFLATFYGISTANIFWLPLAGKLKQKSGIEMAVRELMLEGVLSIQRGDNPSIVRDKLDVFLAKAKAAREEGAAEPKGAARGGEVA